VRRRSRRSNADQLALTGTHQRGRAISANAADRRDRVRGETA